MYWNRWDICLAYWVFASQWHGGQGSKEYAIFATLERLQFRVGRSFSEGDFISGRDENANALAIYRELLATGGKRIRDRR